MPSSLPVSIEAVLRNDGIESSRVEFKASWDERTTGPQVIRTICAFANDFQNLNGGYIVIGVAEEGGRAVLPPKGLLPQEIEDAQKWIRGQCNRIDPVFMPVLSPELFEDRRILVIWAPGSDTRPHQSPEDVKGGERHYFIRVGSETIDADRNPELRTQLLQLTARVPFDDRRALHASVNDLRETKVREFLNDVRSDLVNEADTRVLYRNLRIAVPVNGKDAPKNIGLLFFSQDPEQWFSGARIEVVQFSDDAGGSVQEEKVFNRRPIQEQLRDCLAFLEGLSVRQLEKLPNRPEAASWVGYPSRALREALVNAVYHRSYEGPPEPIKVYLYPDRMEVISYPGPVPGIEPHHLEAGGSLPPVPARNRRIGEFLKELRLAEGRSTGIPAMRRVMVENGSPPPKFDFDSTRTYFRVTLPAHPEYVAISALQDAALLRAKGETSAALSRLIAAFGDHPASVSLATELIRELARNGDLPQAENVFAEMSRVTTPDQQVPARIALASALLDAGRKENAIVLLNQMDSLIHVQNAVEAAIQEKRAGRFERAHQYFALAGDALNRDVRALHEFAQTKMKLADGRRKQVGKEIRTRLLREAREMLERVTQMEASPIRRAWAWYDLGRVLRWMKSPSSDVRRAFAKAAELLPNESRFQDALRGLEKEAR